jgi:cyclopropane fatty-acyl-phospholipid synthase-like methyltransferase
MVQSASSQEILELVNRHLHCGFWESPQVAEGSPEDLARATEEMCRRFLQLAKIADGQKVLDVGCGTGGTLASVNDRFTSVSLVGVNISLPQLATARRRIVPRPGNTVGLIAADGCALPLDSGAFDRVMAVESTPFFSRARFFAEVKRVLRPGGRLLVVDFLPEKILRPLLAVWDHSVGRLLSRHFAQTNLRFSVEGYGRLAAAHGFELESCQDWTLHTLPSYPTIRRVVLRDLGRTDLRTRLSLLGSAATEQLSRRGLVRYRLLLFRDQRGSAGSQPEKAVS